MKITFAFLMTVFTFNAQAYMLECQPGASYETVRAFKSRSCRYEWAILVKGTNRCLAETSRYTPSNPGRFAACVRLYSGTINGIGLAALESSLAGQDGKIILE